MNVIKQLYWYGIAPLSRRFEHCDAVESYLKTLTIHDGHVPLRGDGTSGSWESMLDRAVVCPPLIGGTLIAPHFLEFVLGFTDTVAEYLGEFPYLYSVHSFWARPSGSALNPDIQEWHRDRDADKFVTLFILGSDIDTYGDGPHLYQAGTHVGREGEPARAVFGKAGYCFLADTRGLHRGMRPDTKTRLMHWARWCAGTEPRSYGWDKMQPIPANWVPLERPSERLRESTKLVVNWS